MAGYERDWAERLGIEIEALRFYVAAARRQGVAEPFTHVRAVDTPEHSCISFLAPDAEAFAAFVKADTAARVAAA